MEEDLNHMDDVIIKEVSLENNGGKIIIFTYTGEGDPVNKLNLAISYYLGKSNYREFIDMNMDNPWVRIITIDVDFYVKNLTPKEKNIKKRIYKTFKQLILEIPELKQYENESVSDFSENVVELVDKWAEDNKLVLFQILTPQNDYIVFIFNNIQ